MVLREMAVSWKYGVSGIVDAYQVALTLTTWVPMAIGSVLTIVLVPALVRTLGGDAPTRQRFIEEIAGNGLLVAAALLLLTWIAAPPLAAATTAALPEPTQRLAADMARWMAPASALMVLAALLACRTMARERHANSLLEGLPGLAIAVAVVAWPGAATGTDLLAGFLLGTAIQFVWLAALLARDPDRLGRPRVGLAASPWSLVVQATGVTLVGQVLMTLIAPLEQVAAAQLGAGAVATLGYANRILTLIASLGALVISRALLPVLSSIAQSDPQLARSVAIRWSSAMLAAGACVAAVGWFLAPPVVALLFERGAFGRTETLAVADALRWGLLQFPFYFAGVVLVQSVVAASRYRLLAAIGALNLVVKLVAMAVLVPELEIAGITLSSAAMYAFSWGLLALSVRRLVPKP
jgi:peptidoglycan biosynthesis protein MviN/MurJ (putative lipid II flippase)